MRLLVLLHRVHVLVLLLLHLDRAVHVRLHACVHLARHHAIHHPLLRHHAVALLSQGIRVVTAEQHRCTSGMLTASIRRCGRASCAPKVSLPIVVCLTRLTSHILDHGRRLGHLPAAGARSHAGGTRGPAAQHRHAVAHDGGAGGGPRHHAVHGHAAVVPHRHAHDLRRLPRLPVLHHHGAARAGAGAGLQLGRARLLVRHALLHAHARLLVGLARDGRHARLRPEPRGHLACPWRHATIGWWVAVELLLRLLLLLRCCVLVLLLQHCLLLLLLLLLLRASQAGCACCALLGRCMGADMPVG